VKKDEGKRTGSKPERLKLKGEWQKFVGKALERKRPAKGWPKRKKKWRSWLTKGGVMTLFIACLLIYHYHMEWWWYAIAAAIWAAHMYGWIDVETSRR
jgi:hypothetical protein